jgi:hypothetical protein
MNPKIQSRRLVLGCLLSAGRFVPTGSRRALVLMFTAFALSRCSAGPQGSGARAEFAAQHLPCLSADSLTSGGSELVYTSKTAADVTGDIVGQELRLRSRGAAMSGTYVVFVGGPAPLDPPAELAVTLDRSTGVIEFDDQLKPGRNHFRGTFTCDSLFGELTRPAGTRGEVLRRVQ